MGAWGWLEGVACVCACASVCVCVCVCAYIYIYVCVCVCTYVLQSRSLITKSDVTNSGYNEAQKLVPAKILYMNRNASVIANSGYNEISVIANWFC